MISNASDGVEGDLLRLGYTLTQILMELALNVVRNDRVVSFRVPSDVEMNFRVNVAWHFSRLVP